MRCLVPVAVMVTAAARDMLVYPDTSLGATVGARSIQACVDELKSPGDRCLLKAGTYAVTDPVTVHNKKGTRKTPIVIGAAGDGPVIIDGTADVMSVADGVWEKASDVGSHVFALKLQEGVSVTQLFVEDSGEMQMQVPARWPNAGWKDGSMFMGPEHWAHAGPSGSGTHDYDSGTGILYDMGKCNKSADCCSDCNGNDLAASGIDATGAIAVLQLWANGVGLEQITHHKPGSNKLSYHASWCKEEVERRGKCSDGYRGGRGRYYLEGSLGLLDAPSEWHFDVNTQVLHFRTESGTNPKNMAVRIKASTHAFNITGSTQHLTLANLTFMGTALEARSPDDSINNLRFESLQFNYPASQRRLLGEFSQEKTMLVWTDDNRAVQTPTGKAPAWTNHTFTDVAWRYADGMGLQYQGSGARFKNCLWEWNSWTGMSSASPDSWSAGGTLTVGGLSQPGEAMFHRLTFRNNGASKALRPPHESDIVIEYVDFSRQLQLADDGCMVETGSAHSAAMRHNWCHDSGKSALRFDGDDATGTANGEMSYNVAWNISGLVIKGDNHTIIGNTVFDGSDISASKASSSFPSFQDDQSPLDFCVASANVENPGQTTQTAGKRNVFKGNLFDRVENWKTCTNDECPFVGSWDEGNLVGSSSSTKDDTVVPIAPFNIKVELRDPWNHDFRPCPGSNAAKQGAGAYPVYTTKDHSYWIPGAKERLPSHPSPVDGQKAPVNAELLFLPAYRAVSHKVYFGSSASALQLVTTTHGENNVVRPGNLKSHTAYSWRVDAVFADGTKRVGEEWSFTTSADSACSSQGILAGKLRDACSDAMSACCSDVAKLDGKCMNHISRHNSSLVEAGCGIAEEEAFCSTCGALPLRAGHTVDCPDCFFLV